MNTNMNKKIFLKQNNLLPTLYMYMVFAESLTPILFACQDDASNVYICSCHCQNAIKQEWIIAPTTYSQLIDLLTDKLSIKDIFVKDKQSLYIATINANIPSAKVVKRDILSLHNILPTAGCYMEADPGEFDEELEILQSETCVVAEFTKTIIQNSFNTLVNSFLVNISVPDTAAILSPASYLSSSHELSFMVPTR